MAQEDRFEWVPFYKKLADKLLGFKNDRTALVTKLQGIVDSIPEGQNMRQAPSVTDLEGLLVNTKDIDPFTTIGLFNRGSKGQSEKLKLWLVNKFAKSFEIRDIKPPRNFSGISTLDSRRNETYFFSDGGDIDDLWNLYDHALKLADVNVLSSVGDSELRKITEDFSKSFNQVVNKAHGLSNSEKILKVLSWVRPDYFLSIDKKNIKYIKDNLKIPEEIKKLPNSTISAEDYLKFRAACLEEIGKGEYPYDSFLGLTDAAYFYGDGVNYYWVNQSKTSHKKEERLGIIKAPTKNTKDKPEWHWEILKGLKPDDKLLSYVDGKVVAELTVKKTFRIESHEHEKRPTDHYVVEVDYNNLEQPVPVPLANIEEKAKWDDINIIYPDGPFSLATKQIYCCRSTKELHDLVLRKSRGEITTDLHKKGGKNTLLYGVPGSGKSWRVNNKYLIDPDTKKMLNKDQYVRILFHPDYTYSDFVGQILPVVGSRNTVSYEFKPGPFTTILKKAIAHPENKYVLVIEEINRGNAPAIFGDIFQLLDRSTSTTKKIYYNHKPYPEGVSEYGIRNEDIAKEVYTDEANNKKGSGDEEVFIPPNLTIVATMNTSDQNVFTLDTAFQRRWEMRLVPNEFNEKDELGKDDKKIYPTSVTWRKFWEEINKWIDDKTDEVVSDKRIGPHFVRESDLKDPKKFSEKVIKYLWDDAFKFNREALFDTELCKTLDSVIAYFNPEPTQKTQNASRFDIFREDFRKNLGREEIRDVPPKKSDKGEEAESKQPTELNSEGDGNEEPSILPSTSD